MTALVFAGGSIYALPYLRQGFYNAMRDAFGVSNVQLGFLNSAFGVFALACYFPGGWVADRFSPRKLMVFSLVATGLGGLVFATLPPYPVVLALHAFWVVVHKSPIQIALLWIGNVIRDCCNFSVHILFDWSFPAKGVWNSNAHVYLLF